MPREITVEVFFCTLCFEENKIQEKIDQMMISRFPEWADCRSYPANHPIWDYYAEVLNKYSEKCMTIEGCDFKYGVCKKHLEQFLEQCNR